VERCRAARRISRVVTALVDDEKDAVSLPDAIGRKQDTTIVNRPGLTKVLRYNTKPEPQFEAPPIEPTQAAQTLGLASSFQGRLCRPVMPSSKWRSRSRASRKAASPYAIRACLTSLYARSTTVLGRSRRCCSLL